MGADTRIVWEKSATGQQASRNRQCRKTQDRAASKRENTKALQDDRRKPVSGTAIMLHQSIWIVIQAHIPIVVSKCCAIRTESPRHSADDSNSVNRHARQRGVRNGIEAIGTAGGTEKRKHGTGRSAVAEYHRVDRQRRHGGGSACVGREARGKRFHLCQPDTHPVFIIWRWLRLSQLIVHPNLSRVVSHGVYHGL